MTRIVVHGHFYQPPRDNPWTGAIDDQPSAAPYRNWNERVHAECYRPNAFAKIPVDGAEMRVNNFERMSFNVGPTLLQWMEVADPKTYGAILEADATSVRERGRGNALAQAFHHTILPLSSPRDVRTQMRWGVADFKHRFGRDPDGMWLPETACNPAVLDVLIEEGIAFTILAPHQARRWRAPGGRWIDARDDPVDTRRPYRHVHEDGSGRSMTVFFYDSDIARAIAFEHAGSSAEGFLELFQSRDASDGMVVHAATDGETYGHHHRFTDLGLAYALFVEAGNRGIEPTNYAAFLDRYPAEAEVQVVGGKGTSWSCAHGVGRWTRNCGCSTGGEDGWNQTWRAPLRSALQLVKRAADDAFDRIGHGVFPDPWGARDRYVDVVIGRRELDGFVRTETYGDDGAAVVAADLLELQHNAMSMFTSCGWFFNDVGGIETIQILRYAARTLELMEAVGAQAPRSRFLSVLSRAKSNDPAVGTGADAFREAEAARPQDSAA